MAGSTVEIAKKQRHILLLEKVKGGKALTAAEMRELDGYERGCAKPGSVPGKAAGVQQEASRGQSRAGAVKRSAVRVKPSDVQEAGLTCETLAAAAERLGIPDLAERIERSKQLAKAWDRGRLLRRVREVAGTTYVVPEAADKLLGLAKGSFIALYAADRLVRDLWDAQRFELLLATEQGWAAKVKEGDPKAIAAVQELFDARRPAAAEVDYGRLSPSELGRATGILPQQWARWVRENGCPQSVDGTYAVPRVLDWLRRWERDKATGGKEAAGLNPMQAQKARMYQLQADEAEGRLIDRATIVRLFRERAARLVQLLSESVAEQWSHAHEGQTAAQLKDAYLAAFRRVRETWKEFPAEVPLPPEARAKIEEGIQMLLTTETQSPQRTEKGTGDDR